jgi:small conductance mechanosensitive channel
MQEQLVAMALAYAPKALVAVAMLAAGWFTARWISSVTGHRLERHELEPPVRTLLLSVLRVLILGLFVIMALQNIGVELLPLIAGLGVAGAAVALATQGVLGNMVAGLTIIFSKPFRVGEHIAIAGVSGEVLEIRLSSTLLGQADLSRVVLPNRKIVGETLHNYGKIRQLVLEVPIGYDVDIEQAIDTAQAVLRANARVLRDPAPGVAVARLRDVGVTLGVVSWVAVADVGPASGELNQALFAALRNRKLLRSLAVPIPA